MIEVEHLGGSGPPVVLLHAGVADRRAWHGLAPHLAGVGAVYAYDRRGFGETPPSREPFTHLADLLGVLDDLGAGPAWLVGNSMGGALALDAALTAPERVAGLVLIAPAVSGAPDPDELDPDTARLDERLEAAMAAGDLAEVNRLEAWLWLDGPAGPEGRVDGPARALALAMNAIILGHEADDEAGAADVEAWSRLEEIGVPTTVLWGDRDVPCLIEQFRAVAARVPGARGRQLPGVGHLPGLEQPAELAAAIRSAIAGA